MEDMVMEQFGDIYSGRRVLITGHTGFKGSWLSLWLKNLGAEITGISLEPESEKNHWDLLNLKSKIQHHVLDIRHFKDLAYAFKETQPDIVFHLAAQSLVRRSYFDPLETWSTNVIGTANVLEACRLTKNVKAILVVTSDKCYQNQEWPWGYRETDRLGGHDPYSASKAAVELVAASFRSSFFDTVAAPLVATARAGNVVGGGDWSEDRLIPDVVRAIDTQQSLEIRSPHATRPWQHVLESLAGYLLLGQKLIERNQFFEDAWNFGPDHSNNRTVVNVLDGLQAYWPELMWHQTAKPQLHEANLLYLDSAKAKTQLGWKPVWNFETTIEKTAEWYRTFNSSQISISNKQLSQYLESAQFAKVGWITS